MDYDHIDSMLEQEYIYSKTKGVSNNSAYQLTVEYFTALNAQRWLITMVIGILTGLVAFGIDMGVENLLRLKYYYTIYFHSYCEDCFWLPYIYYTLFSVFLVSRMKSTMLP